MINWKSIIAGGVLVVLVAIGLAAYSVLKTPEAASGPMVAIPLADSATQVTSPSAPAEPTAGAASATSPTNDSTSAPEATTAPESTAAPSTDAVLMQIVQGESEARFVIDEVLNNAPKTVVGKTSLVAGELAIDPQNPTQTRVGIIQINARDLTTDNDFRNRAIKNRILQTDQYEYITFTPAEIIGLPQTADVGKAYTFQISGDLTIRDVTQRVTFDVNATAVSESRVEGTATTTINYADYGITIPQARQVASVADQVRLELDFVAAA